MNKNKTNDHNVDDNMINNESNNEEDKTHCVIKTSIIPKPPPLDIETITKKIKLQRFDTFTNKIIEKIKTRKKNIENNVNPVDTVEQIKEDLNKDYYIMDNEDNNTENNNVLLSSSRKRLFKSIVKEKETNKDNTIAKALNLKESPFVLINSQIQSSKSFFEKFPYQKQMLRQRFEEVEKISFNNEGTRGDRRNRSIRSGASYKDSFV